MDYLFWVNSGFEQLLVVSTLLLGVLAIALVVREIFTLLPLETYDLERVSRNLQQIGGEATTDIHWIYRQLKQGISSGIVANRIETLYRVAQQQQAMSADSMRLIDADKYNSRWTVQILRRAPQIQLLLGTIGLVNGIWQGLSQATAQPNTPFWSIFLPYLQSGMTVLWWALGSAALVALIKIFYQVRLHDFFARLEDLSLTYLQPAFQPLSNNYIAHTIQQSLQSQKQQMEQLSHLLQRLSMSIAQPDNTPLQHLNQSFAKTADQYAALQIGLQKDIGTLTQIVAGYKNQNDEIHLDRQTVLHGLQRHQELLDGIYKKMFDAEFNLGDWIKSILDAIKTQQYEFKDSLKNLLDLTRSNLASTQSTVNRFGVSVKQFETHLETLQTHLTQFNSVIQQASNQEVAKLETIAQHLQTISGQLANTSMAARHTAIPTFSEPPTSPSAHTRSGVSYLPTTEAPILSSNPQLEQQIIQLQQERDRYKQELENYRTEEAQEDEKIAELIDRLGEPKSITQTIASGKIGEKIRNIILKTNDK